MEPAQTGGPMTFPPQRTSLARAMLLELVPLFSIFSAYLLALLLVEPGALPLALIPMLGFFASGLGWFYIGQRKLAWKVLGIRLALAVSAVAMGFWLGLAILHSLGCESARCTDDGPQAGSAFLWVTAVVWTAALLSPVVSAIAISIWLRRHSESV